MSVADAEEFAQLYRQQYRRVYAYCRRRANAEQADDAVAETFLTAWRKREDIPDGDQVVPWLFAVAYRALGHQWRSSSRRSRLIKKLETTGVIHFEGPEDYIVVREESQQILAALNRLRPNDQELLRLTVWEGLGHAEIAQMFDITTDAVKKRVSRARRRLAREYDQIHNSPIAPLLRKEVPGDH